MRSILTLIFYPLKINSFITPLFSCSKSFTKKHLIILWNSSKNRLLITAFKHVNSLYLVLIFSKQAFPFGVQRYGTRFHKVASCQLLYVYSNLIFINIYFNCLANCILNYALLYIYMFSGMRLWTVSVKVPTIRHTDEERGGERMFNKRERERERERETLFLLIYCFCSCFSGHIGRIGFVFYVYLKCFSWLKTVQFNSI